MEGSVCNLEPQSAQKSVKVKLYARTICFCFANLTSLDVKCNNMSFGDPNWMITIGEETLEL